MGIRVTSERSIKLALLILADVNVSLKISLYRSLVISKFTYGHVAWLLDAKTLKFVNGFNSKCLSLITGRSIRDEAVNPTFDLCQHLRSTRLRLLGHILRIHMGLIHVTCLYSCNSIDELSEDGSLGKA